MNRNPVTRNLPALVVGARGWDHPGWQGGFYPEDLPEDWRLTYYANEFEAVLVAPQDWLERPAAGFAQWRADVRAGFRFFLELPALPEADAARALAGLGERVRPLGECLGGLALAPEGAPAARAAWCAQGGQPCPMSVLWTPGGTTDLPAEDTRLGLVRIMDGEAAPRALRATLEAFLAAAAGAAHAFLFFAGEPPGLQALRDTRTLAGLLGA